MNIKINRQELTAKIRWGKKHLSLIIKKAAPLLGVGFIINSLATPFPILETLSNGFVFFGIPLLLFSSASAFMFLKEGLSKVICTGDILIIKNGKEEFQIKTQQIAQFYLKYNSELTQNSEQSKVDLILITKDNQEIDCFNGQGLPAKDGQALEESLEKFLGIEDYYVEGEYQVEGHQKEALPEANNFVNDENKEIISWDNKEGILNKKFQYKWNNGISNQLIWVDTSQQLAILYKEDNQYYQQTKINKTSFLKEIGLSEKSTWNHIPNIFNYKDNLFEKIEEQSGYFLSSYAEKKEISVQQKYFKSYNNKHRIRIVLYADLTLEISLS